MTTITVQDLYRTFRGYENAIRYLSDVLAGALHHRAITPHTNIEVDPVIKRILEEIRLGKNNVCETPPHCKMLAEEFLEDVRLWLDRGNALTEVVAELTTRIREQEIDFVPSVRPGWNYSGEKRGKDQREGAATVPSDEEPKSKPLG